jgi:hypothetical protein
VDAGPRHRPQYAERAPDVVIEIRPGIRDRVLDRLQRREVHHRLDRVALERRCHDVDIADVPDDEREQTDRGPVTVPQVVEDDRRMTGRCEVARREGADVAGAPRDQDAHREGRSADYVFGCGSVRRRGERRVVVLTG